MKFPEEYPERQEHEEGRRAQQLIMTKMVTIDSVYLTYITCLLFILNISLVAHMDLDGNLSFYYKDMVKNETANGVKECIRPFCFSCGIRGNDCLILI